MTPKIIFEHGDQVEFKYGKIWMAGTVNGLKRAPFAPLQPNTIIILSKHGHFFEVEEKDVRKAG